MARGIQPSRVRLIEEAHCEAVSVMRADISEIDLLRQLQAAIHDLPATHPAHRIAAQRIAYNLRENRAHREIDDLLVQAMRAS